MSLVTLQMNLYLRATFLSSQLLSFLWVTLNTGLIVFLLIVRADIVSDVILTVGESDLYFIAL